MADVRLVNRDTGSVVVVPEEKAAGLAILRFDREDTAAKSTAKKSSSSKSKK